jgi:hypothetical protein
MALQVSTALEQSLCFRHLRVSKGRLLLEPVSYPAIYNWMVHIYPFDKNPQDLWSMERRMPGPHHQDWSGTVEAQFPQLGSSVFLIPVGWRCGVVIGRRLSCSAMEV